MFPLKGIFVGLGDFWDRDWFFIAGSVRVMSDIFIHVFVVDSALNLHFFL